MKKAILGILAATALCLTGCGTEKEYKMTIKSELIAAKTEINSEDVTVLHCTRTLSALNYYIVVDATEYDSNIAELVARRTAKTTKYTIVQDGKTKTVSDHGYKFVKWGE